MRLISYKRMILAQGAAWLVLLTLVSVLGVYKRETIKSRVSEWWAKERANSRVARALNSEEASFPRYDLKLSTVTLRGVEEQVTHLMEKGYLSNKDKRWFGASLYEGKTEHPARVRLKGDQSSHWSGKKKSWRVKFEKTSFLNGYGEIDFNLPHERGYVTEKLAYEVARENGLLVPDIGFATMTLNQVDLGLYVWNESLGADMLERQKYPSGGLFQENNCWLNRMAHNVGLYHFGTGRSINHFAPCFKNVVEDSNSLMYQEQFRKFLVLMRKSNDEEFRREISSILDIEKYATWNAISWLFGSTHSHWSDNLRWYYNSTTGKFEPILNDVYRYLIPHNPSGSFEARDHDPLARRLFRWQEFRTLRDGILYRLLSEEDLAKRADGLFAKIRSSLLRGVAAPSAAEIDTHHDQTVRILKKNRARLLSEISLAQVHVTQVQENAKQVSLSLIPDSGVPLIVTSVAIPVAEGQSGNVFAKVGEKRFACEGEETSYRCDVGEFVVYAKRDAQLAPTPSEWDIAISSEEILDVTGPVSLEVSHSLSGERLSASDVFVFQTQKGLHNTKRFAGGLPFKKFPKEWVLESGKYHVRRSIALPSDIDLKLKPGVSLRLDPGVSISVQGALLAEGTKARPIEVKRAVKDKPWGVLSVIQAKRRSRVSHVHLGGGSGGVVEGRVFTGQFNFFYSDVDLRDSVITDGGADDGLNIKHGKFSMTNCSLVNNSSDGFDGDWVEGEVRSSRFIENGGDGLDLSGSRVSVVETQFHTMADKGISAGENTRLQVERSEMVGNNIGVASKDLSQVDVSQSLFAKNKTAVSLYQKKAIFGPATIRVSGSRFQDNGQLSVKDAKSQLVLPPDMQDLG